MTIELKKGVHLTVLPTQKYKTIRIFVRFTASLDVAQTAKRTLLTSLLETTSLAYPTQTAFSSKLAELYGASFGMNVNKRGNLHQINAAMSLVNGKYVADATLLSEAVAFLEQVLFYPNSQEDHFDEKNFTIEKNNLISYMKSVAEDKQALASLALQELYFANDPHQKYPSFGRPEDLVEVTAKDLYQTYQSMLNEDQIDIFVIGDVEEQAITTIFSQLPFTDRTSQPPSVFYQQPVENVIREKITREPITQAKLNLAYHTGVYYDQEDRIALMVFNGLFGGFPHSKLFMNVREKASLAYYASSTIDTFRGYLSVQTGIDGQNRDKVFTLIEEQLQSLQQGEVTAEELSQTKAMLKNQYLLSLDNPQALIETAYLNQWVPGSEMTEETFMQRLEKVSIADVKRLAQQVHLQAMFFLNKEVAHE
ncbi:EF-P 5-aminopentanol modification-associated protein YfmF [Enterococcus sp. DIV0876]|uniref:EF-P 5-aminopentanol modification-associated protein YfmF n=1 Tax=Enterococcus sp. DIV0876 TaxID=2774633 RepID=UPI003D2FC939